MELERNRARRLGPSSVSGLDELSRIGSSGDDPILGAADAGAMVNVVHIPYAERLPVGGMAVHEIRARLQDRLDIDPQSQAFVDGVASGDDTVLRAGQSLRFSRHSGEKGRRRLVYE